MRFPDARILLFAKAPEPGRVKTRLIPAIGADAAAGLYRQLLEATVERIVASRLAPLECWCAPDSGHPVFDGLRARHRIDLRVQQGGDLGARMEAATTDALGRCGGPVLLVGGDCPGLDGGHLARALGALGEGDDAVIGPAEDGGYVLLGLRRSAPDLFRGMPWGTDQVLPETRRRLGLLGWRWSELAPLWDLDRPADLERYRSEGRG